jgi:uncharacterized protein
MTTTPPPPPPANQYQAVQPLNPSDERLWSTLIHVGGIFLGFWPALIGFLVLKDRGPFVREHTKAALNFQITALIANLISALLTLVIIGIFMLIAVSIVVIVFSIIAAIAANSGQYYKYPVSIEFIK